MTYLTIVKDIALTVSPFLLAAATGALAKGAQYALHAVSGIRNKNARDSLDWAISLAEALAKRAVVAANQTIVNELKRQGKFTSTAAHRVFESVLGSVTADLGQKARAILETEVPDVPAFLGSLIESAVATAPNRLTVSTNPSIPQTPAS